MHMDAIRLFCDVARHRSISRGAQLSHITQSAASQRIQALEKELGSQLVDRSKRPLKLTEAGEIYFRGCHAIVDQYQRLCAQLNGTAANGSQLKGEVTVAAIYSAGIDLLNQVKADFQHIHPDVDIAIDYLQPQTVYERVKDQHFDIGILSYPQRWTGLASIPLRNESMVLVARPGHPLLDLEVVKPENLAGRRMVTFDRALPIGRRIARFIREHDIAVDLVSHFDNIDTIKQYVAQTDSVAILPDRTVIREVQSGTLASATLSPRLYRPVALVYARQRQHTYPVQVFREFLLNYEASRKPLDDTVSNKHATAKLMN